MKELDQLIRKGMQCAANLPDIMPEQASSQVAPIYEDIKQTLRVPLVNLIFRTLANYPDYLEQLWKHFSPALRSSSFEHEADNLREKALLEYSFQEETLDLQGVEDQEKLKAFNDTIFYVLPKLLLVTTLFDEATFRGISERRGRGQAAEQPSDIPLGVAEGTSKVDMVDPDKASEQVQALFNSIKQKHEHPLVSSYYRGLANWPDLLEKAWKPLEPLVGSPAYESLRDFLNEQAQGAIRRLPLTQPLSLPLSEQDKEDVRAILAAFRYKFIPEMLVDVAFIKAQLDGPEEAYSSRFSAITSAESSTDEE